MYFDQIKAELVEAQDVLNKFVSDDNNIKLIEKAAKLLAESFKNGGKVLSAVMVVLTVMLCTLQKNSLVVIVKTAQVILRLRFQM